MMDRKISDKEFHYLMDHLDMLYTGASLREYVNLNNQRKQESLFIPLSEEMPDIEKMIRIDGIPVLFPCSEKSFWYSEEKKGITFHHDILKSSFYLISAYQEYKSQDLDEHGRFPWISSIQHSLGITQKPVVNYYFEVILEAFEKFCALHKLDFQRKIREAPVFFLSHDVDRIKKYTLRNLVFSIMQFPGLKPGSLGGARQLKIIVNYATGILLGKKDPYWNFYEMTDLEKELKISSTWYFLEKTKLDNSRYHFKDAKICHLITYLAEKGHEVGIHGTLESSSDLNTLKKEILELNMVSGLPVAGIRQHYLKYCHPHTSRIQSATDLIYDSSLGFAEQIGFRNSYAYPFRLFDFENQRPIDIWQLPLNVMEVSLIGYMNIEIASIPETIRPVLHEVLKFKGVFSLLWHNCRLDEESMPGVHETYNLLLREILNSGCIPLTGRMALDRFISGGASGSSSSA